jgi:cysteine synthase A
MKSCIRTSAEELVGNTPLLKLGSMTEKNGANIFAKLDYMNPGGSVKDRVASNIIRNAEKNGLLRKGHTIVEASGGNMGLSLALIGRLKGYEVVIAMPDQNNERLKKSLKRLGARVELSPVDEGMKGARERVSQICKKRPDHYNPDCFSNPSNAEIHRNTTAREIMKAMGNGKIDAFVAGVGTGGTITGVGEALKSKNPNVKIIAVEPAESPVLSGGKPGSHLISGIGAGVVPPLLNMDIVDKIIQVSSELARKTAEKLSLKEGIIAGLSSGAALYAALKFSAELGHNKNIVVFFADAAVGD